MVYRSSFSQHNQFELCKRMWYFNKILNIQIPQDMCYAHGGSIVHKCLEEYYNNKKNFLSNEQKQSYIINTLKELFNNKWKEYKLDESKISHKKPEYWDMVLNGINLDKTITDTELKIFFDDALCFIDTVDKINKEISDWKTSTRSEDNEYEYEKQVKFYSWLYYKKYNIILNKCVIHYLKYQGQKGILEHNPNLNTIKEMENWYYNILNEMEKLINKKEMPNKCNNCFVFCPYPNICEDYPEVQNNKLDFKITILGHYIKLDGDISELLDKGLTKKFSYELKNSHWIKKNNPFVNTTINFWNSRRRIIPIGFLNGVKKTLSDYTEYNKKELNLQIIDNRIFNNTTINNMPNKFVNNKVLRDYQIEAVNKFLQEKIGILEIGTGGGKTEIAIETIRQLKIKTLFVVDKIELLKQTKERIENSLGLEVGIIWKKENNPKDITIATIQTLIKDINKYREYLNSVRFVIFDECHKIASKSFIRLAHYLNNTEYRLGLSGTAFRDDGNDMAINSVSGPIIMNLGTKFLINKGWLVMPKIIFIKDYITRDEAKQIEDSSLTGLINETGEYSNFYNNGIVNNIQRNSIILNICNKYNTKKILILVKLIEHGNILNKLIPDSKYLNGSTNKDERNKIMEDFKSSKLKILIGTISIFSEGIDIPTLDIVINASANKGDVKTIQVLGRILRLIEGKTNAYYFDFYDNIKFLISASNSRKNALRKQGHHAEALKWLDVMEL